MIFNKLRCSMEIKHSRRPNQPYFSHVMQLVSYCLLVEEDRGEKPKYGFIQYKGGQAFSVPYTEKMKSFLLKTCWLLSRFVMVIAIAKFSSWKFI